MKLCLLTAMRSILFFILFQSGYDSICSASITGPGEVRATAGQTVNIKCSYDGAYVAYSKYWCQGEIYRTCQKVVRTRGTPVNGRVSISEDKAARTFTVTLTSVQPQDEGQYWCVISIPILKNPNAPVYLRVLPSADEPPTISTRGPQESGASDQNVWSTLRWILFFLMLACPLGVCFWERSAGHNCVAVCPRICIHTPPSLLPPLPQTG
ncbi:hypothetical protein GJAV_G00190110 [Gymnothorax javanicus]|nr:hypothetical protein GJAV_G00190110 [Gymnothorax javanicus]